MSDETEGIGCPHEHHGQEFLDPEVLDQILSAVRTALPINNLFVVFAPNPARFILTNIDEDGTLRVIGFIPHDFMLELSMGLIRAYQHTLLSDGQQSAPPSDDDVPDNITPIGPFKVI